MDDVVPGKNIRPRRRRLVKYSAQDCGPNVPSLDQLLAGIRQSYRLGSQRNKKLFSLKNYFTPGSSAAVTEAVTVH